MVHNRRFEKTRCQELLFKKLMCASMVVLNDRESSRGNRGSAQESLKGYIINRTNKSEFDFKSVRVFRSILQDEG